MGLRCRELLLLLRLVAWSCKKLRAQLSALSLSLTHHPILLTLSLSLANCHN
ncbi:hypothetical protein DsansV1_C07g0071301 [Dioscorea sansibarensis]